MCLLDTTFGPFKYIYHKSANLFLADDMAIVVDKVLSDFIVLFNAFNEL